MISVSRHRSLYCRLASLVSSSLDDDGRTYCAYAGRVQLSRSQPVTFASLPEPALDEVFERLALAEGTGVNCRLLGYNVTRMAPLLSLAPSSVYRAIDKYVFLDTISAFTHWIDNETRQKKARWLIVGDVGISGNGYRKLATTLAHSRVTVLELEKWSTELLHTDRAVVTVLASLPRTLRHVSLSGFTIDPNSMAMPAPSISSLSLEAVRASVRLMVSDDSFETFKNVTRLALTVDTSHNPIQFLLDKFTRLTSVEVRFQGTVLFGSPLAILSNHVSTVRILSARHHCRLPVCNCVIERNLGQYTQLRVLCAKLNRLDVEPLFPLSHLHHLYLDYSYDPATSVADKSLKSLFYLVDKCGSLARIDLNFTAPHGHDPFARHILKQLRVRLRSLPADLAGLVRRARSSPRSRPTLPSLPGALRHVRLIATDQYPGHEFLWGPHVPSLRAE